MGGLKPSLMLLLAAITLGVYAIYIMSGFAEFLYQWSKTIAPYEIRSHLGLSKRFLLQYGHCFFLAILLFLSRYIFFQADRHLLHEGALKLVAKYLPAVFLFHFPLLYFFAAVLGHDKNSNFDQFLLLTLVVATSVAIGKICLFLKPGFDFVSAKLLKQITSRHTPKTVQQPYLQLSKAHSEFLNFVKLIAMAAIVLGHFSFEEFTIYALPGFDGSAPRFAVPLFFMLSGYFLMHSISKSQESGLALMFRRAWSLYFLIVPMLIIVPILDFIGYGFDPEIYRYDDYYVFERERGPLGFPIFLATWINSLLYLNEIWIYTLSGMSDIKGGIVAFSNDPYWFMCYLIPFTALMVIGEYTQGRQRLLLLSLYILIVGPPIILLAPLFFSGAWMYKLHQKMG